MLVVLSGEKLAQVFRFFRGELVRGMMRFSSCKTVVALAVFFGFGVDAAWARGTIRITIPRHSALTVVQRLNRQGVVAVQKHDYATAANLFHSLRLLQDKFRGPSLN